MSVTRSIFITNNGLSDHIGTAQILPYLEGLAQRGHRIACLSVERPSLQNAYDNNIAPRLRQAGILHSYIARRTAPVASHLERFVMPSLLQHKLEKLVLSFRPDMIHCRSYMPLGAVLSVSQKYAIPFVFDMRGFWIDERREAGIWQGMIGDKITRHFRKLETKALRQAACIVTLTQDAHAVISHRISGADARVKVIACSVDQDRFRPDKSLRIHTRKELGFQSNEVVLAHLGSAGPLYQMTTTYRLLGALQSQGLRAKVLMIGDHCVHQHLHAARQFGIDLNAADITSRRVPHEQVPALLNAADIGLSFRIATPSSLGVSATKVGEYLSCGLPVISNTGVGDIHHILPDRRFGIVLPSHENSAIMQAAKTISSTPFATRKTIREHATSLYSLDRACDLYDAIYRNCHVAEQAA